MFSIGGLVTLYRSLGLSIANLIIIEKANASKIFFHSKAECSFLCYIYAALDEQLLHSVSLGLLSNHGMWLLITFWMIVPVARSALSPDSIQAVLQSVLCSRLMLHLHMVTYGASGHQEVDPSECISCVLFADLQMLSITEGSLAWRPILTLRALSYLCNNTVTLKLDICCLSFRPTWRYKHATSEELQVAWLKWRKKAVHGMWPVLRDTLVYGCVTVENWRNTRVAGCQVPHTIYILDI